MCAKSFGNSNPGGYRVSVVKLNPGWKKSSQGRHHIFLFDGTWNDSTGINPAHFFWDSARHLWVSRTNPEEAYSPIVTNIVKTHLALAADGPNQITHYFRGVGNDDDHDRINKLTEGAFARYEPSTRHLAYCEFLRNYCDGDRISILGFSRGAASARLFARDLMNLGVLEELMIESRYVKVRNTGELRHDIRTTWPKAKQRVVAGKDLPISFLGVWDTVAFAMSDDEEDWALPANVGHAVHCLALDETRQLYEPTLLTYEAKRAAAVKEVWFAGAHSDVGGGYFSDGLGRLTLDFMWRAWNNALADDDGAALAWRPQLAATYTTMNGVAFMRHSQVGDDDKALVRPRECRTASGKPPRVHPSVERFVQHGGLLFCREESKTFPPQLVTSDKPYQPLAYPGADGVELYDSSAWA